MGTDDEGRISPTFALSAGCLRRHPADGVGAGCVFDNHEVVWIRMSDRDSNSGHHGEFMWERIIELSCPPGGCSPGALIARIIEGTGLPVRAVTHCDFGSWVWDYSDVSPERWERIQPILGERIAKLRRQGLIHHGSW